MILCGGEVTELSCVSGTEKPEVAVGLEEHLRCWGDVLEKEEGERSGNALLFQKPFSGTNRIE